LHLYIKYLGLNPREMGVLSLQGSLRKGERSKRWLHLYIKDLGLNSWEIGVLTITRIPPQEWLKWYEMVVCTSISMICG
jgi:hypothetical protein